MGCEDSVHIHKHFEMQQITDLLLTPQAIAHFFIYELQIVFRFPLGEQKPQFLIPGAFRP
jgi:hypothetical protein